MREKLAAQQGEAPDTYGGYQRGERDRSLLTGVTPVENTDRLPIDPCEERIMFLTHLLSMGAIDFGIIIDGAVVRQSAMKINTMYDGNRVDHYPVGTPLRLYLSPGDGDERQPLIYGSDRLRYYYRWRRRTPVRHED